MSRDAVSMRGSAAASCYPRVQGHLGAVEGDALRWVRWVQKAAYCGFKKDSCRLTTSHFLSAFLWPATGRALRAALLLPSLVLSLRRGWRLGSAAYP